ncbi:uncharacterized protein LOC135144965 isoform X2 [Zophobas morio]|uniref:uncharacterized protein LOC135144965 isoform X2 n=1 Tax=Zophobas morio TaxID=2755281 RepID=UPI0030839B99
MCKVVFNKTLVVGKTAWLRLETLTYLNSKGGESKWDRAVRTTKNEENKLDAVLILGTLKKNASSGQANLQEEERVLLVKQFRPAVDAYTLELPAGLVDEGETKEEAALRELKEECGYSGHLANEISDFVPLLTSSPGLTNESLSLVAVDIDLNSKENQLPKQALQGEETCTVLKVRFQNLI